MKSILPAILLASLAFAEPISSPDREKLLADLESSRQTFLNAIADVKTEAQWNYKPAPDRWSVAECAAHIIATEGALFGFALSLLKEPPVNRAEESGIATDQGVSGAIVDRSKKAKAPPMLEPTGKVVPKAQAVADFEAARAKTVAYVRSTQDDLRAHVGKPGPFGRMDSYQYFLMLSGHTVRHTKQLEEVKASTGYPK